MKKFKVRITKIPTAKTGYQVNGALVNDISSMGGRDYDKSMSNKPKEESRYLTAVPREEANLEAEDGETAFGDINGDGFPEHKIIKGKRHSQGGVPLNLPDGTFIFSDTNSMKISSCPILKMFNKPCGKKSYTPAELAKPYDINKYRVLLEDPDTDEMTRNTAELMIKKYVIKLGALALAQEAKKGFPQGIPKVAKPYMDSVGLSDKDILPNDPNKQQEEVPNNESNSSEMPDQNTQQMQEQPNESAPTQMPDGQPIAQPQEGMMQFGGMRSLRRAEEGGSDDMEVPPELESQCYEYEESYPGGPKKKKKRKKSCRELIAAWHKRKERQDKVTRFFMNAGQTAVELGLAGGAAIGSGYLAPKESGWGRMMRTVGSKIGDFFQEDGGAIGYNDGIRSLRRANEGMEQMPEEEMMQPQQQPQQESGDQMQQIIQQVGQALQQGAKPQEIVSNLLENRIPPEKVMEIFINLGVSEDKAEQLVMSVVQQMQSKQQQAPMAMFGMSLAGYQMPDYMQYGGLQTFDGGGQPGPNDVITGNKRRPLTIDELNLGKPGTINVGKRSGEGWQDLGNSVYGRGDVEGKEWVDQPGGGGQFKGDLNAYIEAICNRMKNGNLKGFTLDQVINKAKVIHTGHSQFEELKAKLANCVTINSTKEYIREEGDTTKEPCYCENGEGKLITKNGQPIELGRDGDGNCIKDDPICHEEPETEEGGGGYNYQYQQQDQPIGMDWSQQDINLSNNMEREKHKKYGPYMTTAAGPEYEPVYDNWLGSVQRDLAQSNANAQLIAKTGPQNRALLTQINNSPENDIERVNKENVGTENQARLTNYQGAVNNYTNLNTAKQKFAAESAFANQEYDNEINDWRYRKTLQQNSGDKNMVDRWNLQTDEFALDPRYGYKVLKNSGKKIKPEENLSTLDKLSRAKASGLYPGIDDKTLLAAINSDQLTKLGGSIYAKGGYVYGNSIYPFND